MASPQRGPGAEPLVRGAKPPEAESILVIGCPREPANLAPFRKCICISTLGATVMIYRLHVQSCIQIEEVTQEKNLRDIHYGMCR